MKELLKNLERVQLSDARNLLLLDTCFIVANLENKNEMLSLNSVRKMATTSFNISELTHIHHLKHNVKKTLREFLKTSSLKIVEIGVNPGEWNKERKFVREIEPELLKKVKDASDAVLIAAAIKTHSDVATKDKHHLFTTPLKNYLNKYNINVYKELKDIKNTGAQTYPDLSPRKI